MHVDSPKAYTISDVDSIPAEMTTPLQLSPLRLVPVETKAVDLDAVRRRSTAPLFPQARGQTVRAWGQRSMRV